MTSSIFSTSDLNTVPLSYRPKGKRKKLDKPSLSKAIILRGVVPLLDPQSVTRLESVNRLIRAQVSPIFIRLLATEVVRRNAPSKNKELVKTILSTYPLNLNSIAKRFVSEQLQDIFKEATLPLYQRKIDLTIQYTTKAEYLFRRLYDPVYTKISEERSKIDKEIMHSLNIPALLASGSIRTRVGTVMKIGSAISAHHLENKHKTVSGSSSFSSFSSSAPSSLIDRSFRSAYNGMGVVEISPPIDDWESLERGSIRASSHSPASPASSSGHGYAYPQPSLSALRPGSLSASAAAEYLALSKALQEAGENDDWI